MERESGYYWVRLSSKYEGDKWYIMYWDGQFWDEKNRPYQCPPIEDGHWTEINEDRILSPDEQSHLDDVQKNNIVEGMYTGTISDCIDIVYPFVTKLSNMTKNEYTKLFSQKAGTDYFTEVDIRIIYGYAFQIVKESECIKTDFFYQYGRIGK